MQHDALSCCKCSCAILSINDAYLIIMDQIIPEQNRFTNPFRVTKRYQVIFLEKFWESSSVIDPDQHDNICIFLHKRIPALSNLHQTVLSVPIYSLFNIEIFKNMQNNEPDIFCATFRITFRSPCFRFIFFIYSFVATMLSPVPVSYSILQWVWNNEALEASGHVNNMVIMMKWVAYCPLNRRTVHRWRTHAFTEPLVLRLILKHTGYV